ncbi:MAG: exodeoxyribonuclease VII small subunit [Planctomycetes bacterium]|nr:exodeoxyribonuclease VII small subunit [Planctomycetota bacterium]
MSAEHDEQPAAPESFAEARERLDAILAELEDDAGDVDRLAARIREASMLIRFCRERLAAARQEVTEVVAELTAEERRVAEGGVATSAGTSAGAEDDASDEPPPDEPKRRRGKAAGDATGGLPF